MTGIYKITSPSGKVYIGQSVDIKQRWISHKCESKTFFAYPLYHSMKKYGYDKHNFAVIHELPSDVDKETLTRYEQLYIDQYRECGITLLNINPAAGSRLGTKHTIEARTKISRALKGRKLTPEQAARVAANNRMRSYPRSEETKRKISEAAKNRTHTTRGFSGRKHTAEAKEKISWKNRKHTEETRIKQAKAALIVWQKRRENAVS